MRRSLIGLTLVGLVLAACSGTATPAATGPKITLELTEFAYSTTAIEIPGGQKVTLELRNKGAVEHDFTIDAIGLKVIVKPGQTAQRAIGPFGAGTTYDVYCSVAGHKESGMTANLTVK